MAEQTAANGQHGERDEPIRINEALTSLTDLASATNQSDAILLIVMGQKAVSTRPPRLRVRVDHQLACTGLMRVIRRVRHSHIPSSSMEANLACQL